MIIDIAPTDIAGLHLAGNPSTVLLRVFALQSFTSDDGLRIIQPGTPNAGPWYKEVPCPVSGTTVSVPSLQLESQTDAFNPGEVGARYYAAFYLPDGGFIAPFQPLDNFQVRHDYNPTDWPRIIKYNKAPYVPAGAYQTYTKNQILGLFQLQPGFSEGGAVASVFGRTGDVLAQTGDYDIPKITGLQAALDSKAGLPHFHDASALTTGIVAPARLGTGLTTPATQFLRGDGTWAVPPTGSGPGGGVNTVFGRTGPDIVALSGDYDIPKISGLQAALDSKAGLPHFHDGSAITAGFINPARLGSLPDSTKFLRGDGVWATVTGTTGTLDLAANYTWTGTHVFKAMSGTFTVLGAAGAKEIIGCLGDSGSSPNNWASMKLTQGTAASIAYDVDGTTNNRRELRLDATAFHLRGPLALETSSDGSTFSQYGGTSFTGGNTAFNISATAAGSQAAGYTIGGLPALMQVNAAGLFNTQSLAGDLITQLVGKRHGFAFNANTRYSVMIDSDPADGAINTPLFVRYNGQLRRIVSDSSKVLTWAVLGGDPTASGVFLRGDGVWAVPPGTGPGGAVSSVGLAVDSTIFASPGPAITSSGTLNVGFAAQAASGSAGKFLAGPLTGSAVPTFRAITASDIPALDAGSITTGLISPARLAPTPDPAKFLRGDSTWQTPPGGTGTGTVTSVTVSPPSSIMLATGNPITAAGIITLVLQTQADKYVFCSPVGGGTPLFRLLATTDIPPLATSQITSGIFPAGRLGAGSSDYQYFLRGDSTWQLISSIGSSSAPVGPALTIAAFDSGGAMVTTLAGAPADTQDGFNIHFRGLGLLLDNGKACNEKYSNGNVCNVFFVDDNGTNGRMLIGPFNSADGTQTSGMTAIFRTGHGLSADGSKAGELILDSRSSGGLGAGVGNSLLAGAHWKGWFAISNYSTTTGVPLVPTAPLTVGRNDGNSNLVDLYVRGVVGAPLKINANAWTSPSNTMRTLGAVTWMFSNSADSARTSRLDFYIVQNGGDLLKMRLEPASGANNTGLFLSRSSDPPGSGPTEVVLLDSTTFPGFRYLALPM